MPAFCCFVPLGRPFSLLSILVDRESLCLALRLTFFASGCVARSRAGSALSSTFTLLRSFSLLLHAAIAVSSERLYERPSSSLLPGRPFPASAERAPVLYIVLFALDFSFFYSRMLFFREVIAVFSLGRLPLPMFQYLRTILIFYAEIQLSNRRKLEPASRLFQAIRRELNTQYLGASKSRNTR